MINSSFRYKRLADEDTVSGAGSDLGGISSHDDSENDGTLDHISNFFILQPKKVVPILYSRYSNCKAYNYHKVAGDNF